MGCSASRKNAVINNNNNNYGGLQDIILLLKIPTGTRKYFFDIYRTFVHAPSKVFTSPV